MYIIHLSYNTISGIPALLPVVEHVFLATSCTDLKQLEAQREVVLAMLLRLAEYHQVKSKEELIKKYNH